MVEDARAEAADERVAPDHLQPDAEQHAELAELVRVDQPVATRVERREEHARAVGVDAADREVVVVELGEDGLDALARDLAAPVLVEQLEGPPEARLPE